MNSSILNHPRSRELQDPYVFAARVIVKQLKLYENRSKTSEEIHTFRKRDYLSIDFSYGWSCNDKWLKVHAPRSGFIRAVEHRNKTIKLKEDPRMFFLTSWKQFQSLEWKITGNRKRKKPLKIEKKKNLKYAKSRTWPPYVFCEARKSLKDEKKILCWLKDFFDDIIVSELIYEFLVQKRVKFILKGSYYTRSARWAHDRCKKFMIRNGYVTITHGVSIIYQDADKLINLDTLAFVANRRYEFTVDYCDFFDDLHEVLKKCFWKYELNKRGIKSSKPVDVDSLLKQDGKGWVFRPFTGAFNIHSPITVLQ